MKEVSEQGGPLFVNCVPELVCQGGTAVRVEHDGFWSPFRFEIAFTENGPQCIEAGEGISGAEIRFEFLHCKEVLKNMSMRSKG